jgi:hypothetical protein
MTINWQELADGLEIEWRRLEDVELVKSSAWLWKTCDDLIERARQREEPTRGVLDAAVRVFARGWHWPELSSDEKYFLKMRLQFAWQLAKSFVPLKSAAPRSPAAPKPLSEQARSMLEWLLIDLWPSLSFPIWMELQIQTHAGRSDPEQLPTPVLCHPHVETTPALELRLSA